MPRKKTSKKKTRSGKKSGFEKEIKKFEKQVNKEIKEVEGWIIERRKFFIKLAWVVGIIAVLLIISHYYLRTPGFG